MIGLSEPHLEAIRAHGARDYPQECVGVLLGEIQSNGHKIVREVRPLLNTFSPSEEFERSIGSEAKPDSLPGQERRFRISPDTMLELIQEEQRAENKVLGFYHSHPNHPAAPSVYDRVWAAPCYTYLILAVQDGVPAELTAWELDADDWVFVPETLQIGGDN